MKGLKRVANEINQAAKTGRIYIPLYYDFSTNTVNTNRKGFFLTYIVNIQTEKQIKETVIKYLHM